MVSKRHFSSWDNWVAKKGSFFATAISAVRNTFASTNSLRKTSAIGFTNKVLFSTRPNDFRCSVVRRTAWKKAKRKHRMLERYSVRSSNFVKKTSSCFVRPPLNQCPIWILSYHKSLYIIILISLWLFSCLPSLLQSWRTCSLPAPRWGQHASARVTQLPAAENAAASPADT